MSDEDPAEERDLGQIPTEDLREWLRIEQNVLRDFYSTPKEGRPATRARWARGRIKRIEVELRRRSGRLLRGDE